MSDFYTNSRKPGREIDAILPDGTRKHFKYIKEAALELHCSTTVIQDCLHKDVPYHGITFVDAPNTEE